MGPLNLLETRSFLTRFRELERTVYRQQVARQPYKGDWYDVNPSLFTRSSAIKIYVHDETIWTTYEISSWVRIQQLGVYGYFYIINKGTDGTDNYWIIDGGSNYTFSNNTIQNIGMSTLERPTGTLGTLQYTPAIAADVGTPTFDDEATFYSMKGNQISIYQDAGINCDATAFQIEIDLPFEQGVPDTAEEAYVDAQRPIYVSGFPSELGLFNILTVAVGYDVFVITPSDFGMIGTTFFRVNFFETYLYLPPDL